MNEDHQIVYVVIGINKTFESAQRYAGVFGNNELAELYARVLNNLKDGNYIYEVRKEIVIE